VVEPVETTEPRVVEPVETTEPPGVEPVETKGPVVELSRKSTYPNREPWAHGGRVGPSGTFTYEVDGRAR
jgi:hypothetical protein